ncbi:hypothetical protein G5I_10794 [Acromyrmex echinatior]|uniref:Uncharacterized protein n=1 Tax=Acromyrmex echinatior TaxID=103372 RepID=F4WXV1_ACREC|nr:hypothetical protein G5I_10794 [Acromyrmex echinatior]
MWEKEPLFTLSDRTRILISVPKKLAQMPEKTASIWQKKASVTSSFLKFFRPWQEEELRLLYSTAASLHFQRMSIFALREEETTLYSTRLLM